MENQCVRPYERRRDPAWELRLKLYIEGVRFSPYKLGVHDCCTFTLQCLRCVTGKDYSSYVFFYYSTKRDVKSLLSLYGGFTELVNKVTNIPPQEFTKKGAFVTQLSLGDICLFYLNEEEHLGVFCNGAIYCPGAEGLMLCDPRSTIRFWRA